MRLTEAEEQTFVEQGVVVLPQVVAAELVGAALAAVTRNSEGKDDKDAAGARTNVTGDHPAVLALYHESPLRTLFEGLLGGETQPIKNSQIAIRQPTPPDLLGHRLCIHHALSPVMVRPSVAKASFTLRLPV